MKYGWKTKSLPDANRVREALDYNPETGDFLWRQRPVDHFRDALVAARWNAKNAGRPAFMNRTHGYRAGKFDGVTYFAHRIAWLYVFGDDPEVIDHLNGVRSDNRISNLRSGSQSDNVRSAMARGVFTPIPPTIIRPTSGIIRTASGKWIVRFKRNRRTHYLGTYACFGRALNERKNAEACHVADL